MRAHQALTHRDLAAKSGVAVSTIVDLENGRSGARMVTVRKLVYAEPRELMEE